MPVTDTSTSAWLRQKNAMSASSGLAKTCDLISSTLFAKAELNPDLKRTSSPSDPSADERKLYGERQSTKVTFSFRDEQLFMTQIHTIENFRITEWKCNMKEVLSPCYIIWKSKFQGSCTWTDSQTLEELWKMASCIFLLNCPECIRCRKHHVIRPCNSL